MFGKGGARPSMGASKHAFPSQQLFVLALCRICEPIAFMSIFPYVLTMVQTFPGYGDEKKATVYAGLITSAFAFAEFSTGVAWGKMSDRVGRKPVLLMGLFGTGFSMLMFGFASNLWVAMLARAMGGFLNGNIGVLQTTVAEVVKVKEHQARAYSIMPFVWCLGTIIGSGLGGTLANPVKGYPSVFSSDSIFATYPYLLPNLVCTGVVLVGLVIGILFLEETHEDKKHRRDIGLEIGNWILRKVCCRRTEHYYTKELGYFEETFSLITEDEQPPAYRSAESSPTLSSTEPSLPEPPSEMISEPCQKVQKPRVFTRQVVFDIVSYGILAFHTITIEILFPSLMLGHDDPKLKSTLPFKFTGGYGMTTKELGFMLSVQGLLQMIVQVFIFPIVSRKFGSICTFRAVVLSYPLLYVLAPYLVLLPGGLRMPGAYAIIFWKVAAQSMSYPSLAILLANSAPTTRVLGTLNGVAASAASLSRAFGPTVAGAILSVGLRFGYLGLGWWASGAVAFTGGLLSLFMVESDARFARPDTKVQRYRDEEEALLGEGVEGRDMVDPGTASLPKP